MRVPRVEGGAAASTSAARGIGSFTLTLSRRSAGEGTGKPGVLAGVLAIAIALLLPGCTTINGWLGIEREIAEPLGLIAVLPIERSESGGEAQPMPENADEVVTAAIYGVLSASSTWRFVPDLTITDAVSQLDPLDDLGVRALKLGRAVGADSVLFGTVSRFSERVGSEAGATQPAAVSIQLKVASVSTRKVIWRGEFSEQQQSLSENLFNFWQFWRGGPRWFSAGEFARLGVERLLEDLEEQAYE